MRVTNSMITSQVTRNLERSLTQFMKLQGQMSTGLKLMRPSDDPVGVQKDLKYREILSQIEQYRNNAASAKALSETYETNLTSIKSYISNARVQALSAANDDQDAAAREATAHVVESNYESILDMINARQGDRYIYSGFRTNSPAFRSSGSGVTYIGDQGTINVEIESSSRVGVNLLGSDVLLSEIMTIGRDVNFDSGISIDTALADLNLGEGLDLGAGTFTVADNNTGTTVTIDISTANNIGDIIALVNTQLIFGGIPNLGLDIGEENNNLSWTTLDTGTVTVNTPLENMNNGYGVDLNGGLRIHNDSMSIDVNIDLSGATTLGQAISAINTQLTAAGINNVTASINGTGTGINIVDSNGTSLGLTISESGGGSTAADLGIIGDIDPTLNGTALHPSLDFSVTESVIGETLAADLGLLGDFSLGKVGDPLEAIISDSTPLSLLNHGLGLELGEIKISQGDRQVVIDLSDPGYTTVGDLINALNSTGLDITASLNEAQTGIEIHSNINTESLKIEEVDDGRAAHTLGIYGSPDIMGSMQLLIDALKNDDRESIGQLVENLELAENEVLTYRGRNGSLYEKLENTESRLLDQNYSFTKLLSDVEDADLAEITTKLAMQENSYQAALIATAKIIQPSLLNFLD